MPEAIDVPARIEALWRTRTLPVDAGVVHVVATWFDGDCHRVIRIEPDSPKSDADFFALNLTRARADIILTTGQILRDEPELEYALPDAWSDAMTAWREAALGRTAPPKVAVLTSGRGIDPEHPAFHGWASPVVLTSTDAARALRRDLPAHVRVIGLPSTEPRDVVATLRADGAKTIAIEAGPSTARALYAEPSIVDELSWSQYCGPDLAHELRGRVVFPESPDAGTLRQTAPAVTLEESSGKWRFSRHVRTPPG
ncbi:MAG: dihydrofolate reductase family protein [Nannocystaceae bacterium]|nr:dihydrofolate reductase family protein [bacterium]